MLCALGRQMFGWITAHVVHDRIGQCIKTALEALEEEALTVDVVQEAVSSC